MEHVPRRSSFSIRARSSLPPSRLPAGRDQRFSSSLPYASPALAPSFPYPPAPPPFLGSTFFRVLPRHPYRKCIYVLCKAGNRRWPREPDARHVINTDALVPSSSLRPVSPLLHRPRLVLLHHCFFYSVLPIIRFIGRPCPAPLASIPMFPKYNPKLSDTDHRDGYEAATPVACARFARITIARIRRRGQWKFRDRIFSGSLPTQTSSTSLVRRSLREKYPSTKRYNLYEDR